MNKEALAKFIINDPSDTTSIFEFPDIVVDGIVKWIQMSFTPVKSVNRTYSSYGFKHILENAIGLYMTENQFKMAMILAGFEPSNYNSISHYYRIGRKSPIFSIRNIPDVHQISVENFETALKAGIEINYTMPIMMGFKWKDTDEYFNINECIELYHFNYISEDYKFSNVSINNKDIMLFKSDKWVIDDDGRRRRKKCYKIVDLSTHKIVDVDLVSSIHVWENKYNNRYHGYRIGVVKVPDEERINFDISKFKNIYNTDYAVALNKHSSEGILVEYFNKI